jgi:hypothetical protein
LCDQRLVQVNGVLLPVRPVATVPAWLSRTG